MTTPTKKESEVLLTIFKDFSHYYNANSISKILGISRVGAMKIFRRLLKENIVEYQKIGKSIIYKPKLDDYACKLIAFLLVDEANNFKRWKEEFKELFKEGRIILLFGSAVKNYSSAKDIDIMIIAENKDSKEINAVLREKERLLPKKLHAITLTAEDLSGNIGGKNKATIDIIKNAIVLYGQDKYVEIIKNVAGF